MAKKSPSEQADMDDNTIITRPLPKRPDTGLLAWLATIGYLGIEYSPDAMLTIRVMPDGANGVLWSSAVSWAQETVSVQDCAALGDSLRDLWKVVEREHKVFKTLEAATKRPANYPEDRWIDADTQAALEHLIEVTSIVFEQQWMLIVVYQAVENPNLRVQARLLARDNTVHIGGSGPTILDACRDLYRNAAPGYFASSGRQFDGYFA
jgi:hypothetical protein